MDRSGRVTSMQYTQFLSRPARKESNTGNQNPSNILSPKTILFWSTEEKLYGFKNMEKILPTRLIEKSDSPYPLTYELIDIDNLTYIYKNNPVITAFGLDVEQKL